MAAYRRLNPAVKSFTNTQTITVLTTKVWRSHRKKDWECLKKRLHIWAPSEEDQEGGGGGRKEQQRHRVQPSQQSNEDGKEPHDTDRRAAATSPPPQRQHSTCWTGETSSTKFNSPILKAKL